MNNYTQQNTSPISRSISSDKTDLRAFLSSVFSFMFLGLTLTALTAYYSASSGLIHQLAGSPLMWVVMLAPLGMVLIMGAAYKKLSANVMTGLFILFAIVNGISFGSIFITFSLGAIYKAFIAASLVFGLMALVGYTTKTDLTKLGSILMIGVVAIIIMMVINYFTQSSTLDYIISLAGVAIFTGLTAYDMQKLKNIGSQVEAGTASTRKLAVWGALDLYLDFVNLFLFILRLLDSD